MEASSPIRSWTGTSFGISALRVPPLGRMMETLISDMDYSSLYEIRLRSVVGHLAGAGDCKAVPVVQGVADIAFPHSARVIPGNRIQTIGAQMPFDLG